MIAHIFDQHPYRCRMDWGYRGAREAAERGDILVIVDTLSFATAVATAVHHGAVVYPCARDEDPAALARLVGGEVAVGRDDVPSKGRFSLSPLTYVGVSPGTRIVLASPNGATCSRAARDGAVVFAGALVNATAIAEALSGLLAASERSVTVVACGEQWRSPSEERPLRAAIEDYLGAGAILSALPGEKSPEARVCEGAFRHARPKLAELVWECGSGRELRERGYAGDVEHAARLDRYDTAAILRDGCFRGWD